MVLWYTKVMNTKTIPDLKSRKANRDTFTESVVRIYSILPKISGQ